MMMMMMKRRTTAIALFKFMATTINNTTRMKKEKEPTSSEAPKLVRKRLLGYIFVNNERLSCSTAVTTPEVPTCDVV